MEQIKKKDLISALKYIKPSDLDYQGWIEVGMGLKEEGFDWTTWDEWSRDDARYKPHVCETKWHSFNGSTSNITGATILKRAIDNGWSPANGGYELSFDDYFTDDEMPIANKTPVEQFREYLTTLFKEDEHVNIVIESIQREDGKWTPCAKGDSSRTAGELIRELDRHPKDLGATIGDWNEEAGAWIRFNPCDGKGVRNTNTTAYRFALVESDEISIEEQRKAYIKYNLPIAALVYSGTKSLHAIVRIDAKDEKEYAQRVSFLYQFLEDKGFKLDTQNKNVMRLSRLPGASRNGNIQNLEATNIGASSWSEWRNSQDDSEADLPPMESLDSYFAHPTELPKPIIDGILRQGRKMILLGDSKAGKSFCLMQLVVAFAEGSKWLGCKCEKLDKVLYINFEIAKDAANKRFLDIYKALGLPTDPKKNNCKNIIMWHLRGKAVSIKSLYKSIISGVNNYSGIQAIVIDPIYKILGGDENSAADVTEFCNAMDKIAVETGASVIYAHHHAKGAQSGKKSIDRGSGSGVLARDPDAILDISALDITTVDNSNNTESKISWSSSITGDNQNAFRVTGSLREFKQINPINVWFNYPIHVVDTTGELEKQFLEGDTRNNLKQNQTSPQEKKKILRDALLILDPACEGCNVTEISEYIGRTRKTTLAWLKQCGTAFQQQKNLWFTAESLARKLRHLPSIEDELD